MRRLRLSIAEITAIVVLVALDCLVWRELFEYHGATVLLVLVGTPLMVNTLAIGLLLMRRRRRQRETISPFLAGFEVAGWISLVIYVAIAAMFVSILINHLDTIVTFMDNWFESTGVIHRTLGTFVLEHATVMTYLTIPQLIPAVVAGAILRRYRVRLVIERRERSGRERSDGQRPLHCEERRAQRTEVA